MLEFSCKDCKARALNCHSVCKKYITEKAIHDRNLKKKKTYEITHGGIITEFDFNKSLGRR